MMASEAVLAVVVMGESRSCLVIYANQLLVALEDMGVFEGGEAVVLLEGVERVAGQFVDVEPCLNCVLEGIRGGCFCRCG